MASITSKFSGRFQGDPFSCDKYYNWHPLDVNVIVSLMVSVFVGGLSAEISSSAGVLISIKTL